MLTFHPMNLTDFFNTFWHFLTLSAPALLLGFFLAGLIRAFLPPERVSTWLGKGKWSDVVLASLVGVPIPLCSCSVIPTAIALKQKGASRAATSSFLISTPESGIDSILVTRAMMDWPMTIIRPVAAFASALLAGGLQLIFNPEEKVAMKPVAPVAACCGHNHAAPSKKPFWSTIKEGLTWSINDLVDDLALWMTIGIVAGALLDFFVPADFFLGLGIWPSRLLVLVVGIPLYICASATTPIAASLVMKGLSPGAALILLLAGPATNIANIAVLRPHLGNKGIAINLISIAAVALLAAIGVDAWYGGVQPAWAVSAHTHEHGSSFGWESILAAVLVVILLRGLWRAEIQPRLNRKKDCCHT